MQALILSTSSTEISSLGLLYQQKHEQLCQRKKHLLRYRRSSTFYRQQLPLWPELSVPTILNLHYQARSIISWKHRKKKPPDKIQESGERDLNKCIAAISAWHHQFRKRIQSISTIVMPYLSADCMTWPVQEAFIIFSSDNAIQRAYFWHPN